MRYVVHFAIDGHGSHTICESCDDALRQFHFNCIRRVGTINNGHLIRVYCHSPSKTIMTGFFAGIVKALRVMKINVDRIDGFHTQCMSH
ncbi:hypothetical protein D3C80_1955910 [compost metagenome]